MSNGTAKTLTMRDIEARKQAPRLMFASGRYATRGNPRSGGLSSLYQATDIDTGQSVAVKIFKTGEGTDPVIEESFRREVQALSDLKHPNVVHILGSGRDEEHDAHYIVMEWVERDLREHCQTQAFKDWSDFFQKVGQGVLEALVFAHGRSTVHRDVKPSNVLLTRDGLVKLCDFGISKMRRFLSPGVTLAQFASVPFAPPEPDDGSYSYSRDVFGYAALAVTALAGRPIGSHVELLRALEDAAIDEPVRKVLRRCLTLDDPRARPGNAVLLRGELERAQPDQPAANLPSVLVSLTQRVRRLVEADLGLKGDAGERFVGRDLDGAFAEDIAPTADRPGRSLRLFGDKYGYTAVPDEDGVGLRLVDAVEWPASELERRRSLGCEPLVRFALGGVSRPRSGESLGGLLERLSTHASEQKLRRLEEREQALYRKWLNLLNAKAELEKQRKVKVAFSGCDAEGEFLRLKPVADADVSSLWQKDVLIEVPGAGTFRGQVVSASAHGLSIREHERSQVRMGAVPDEGTVEIDTMRTEHALDRQKSAVDAVRYGRSVNPELGRLIINPDQLTVPPSVPVEFIQTKLDEDKQAAVIAALSGPELLVVEGPPGTGKTTFITEVVLQTLRTTPNARVLLTSQTHVALDNSLERIVKESQGKVDAVRIGFEGNDRIAESARRLMLEAKLPELRKTALASGRAFVERWATTRGISLQDTRRAMALERHAVLRARMEEVDASLQALEPKLKDEFRKTLDAEGRADLDDQFEGLGGERDELDRALKESLKDLALHVASKDDLKEYASCSAADLRLWAEAFAGDKPEGVQLKELLQAHGDWEARFGRGRQFHAAVIAASQVVAGTCLGVMSIPGRADIVYDLCIVDEASIATPTEALVPMARARRTVLVGDARQLPPFQDAELRMAGLLEKFDLRPEDQRATLFNHLREGLPVDLRKALWTQHRMLPAIGDLVSECFYGGELKSVPRDEDPHLKGVQPRPVTWFTTSGRQDRASRVDGTSHYNDCEVDFIVTLLKRMDFLVQGGKGKGQRYSLAILTGYGAQKERLQTAIETHRHAWSTYSEVFVDVVDAFQGREADIVLFSVTRSGAQRLGFLREMERINVALSRAKELLAIVGDHAYCQDMPDAVNPLKDVLDHIRRHPESCALKEVTS